MTDTTVSEAHATLSQVLDRVIEGDEVTITRDGEPVAVVTRPEVDRMPPLSDTGATAKWIRRKLDEVSGRSLSSTPSLNAATAEAMVAEIRAGRDARP